MTAKWLPISAAVIMALGSASASAVDFHGYMRSGVGVSDNGKMQTISKERVGRLGNEDETYSEIQLGQEVYNKGGKTFYVDSMFTMKSDQNRDWEDDATFALRQFNVQAKGLFGSNEVTWAGKRFYQRHDIHITDFYYWDVSGAGAGIEQIKVGPGQMAFAVLRNDPWNDDFTGNDSQALTYDVRYANIPLWQNASLELGVDYVDPVTSDAQEVATKGNDLSKGGYVTAELTWGLLGGFNKTVGQYFLDGLASSASEYGSGSGSMLQSNSDDGKGYRLINWGVLPVGDKIEIGHEVVYGASSDFNAWGTDYDDRDTFSIAARPMYKWTDVMKTIVEVGYSHDTQTQKGSSVETQHDLQKYTIAQAWSAGSGFWARPELRVFASYLKSDGALRADDKGVAQDDAYNFGVQAEAWW